MKYFTVVFPLALLVLFGINLSCISKKGSSSQVNNSLVNKWQWISSTGGIAGKTSTPSSSGFTKTIQFTADDVYSELRNGEEVFKGKYEITPDSVIKMERGRMQELKYSIHQDTLTIADQFPDGFTSIYLKSK